MEGRGAGRAIGGDIGVFDLRLDDGQAKIDQVFFLLNLSDFLNNSAYDVNWTHISRHEPHD